MSEWTRPPEPVTWTLPKPALLDGVSYPTITLCAPNGINLLKATAVAGEDNYSITLNLISAVSAESVPVSALRQVDTAVINQMARYFDMFDGAPLPGPLQDWLAARLAASMLPPV